MESAKHAVLYTGDIRAEPYLVNQLQINPILKQYLSDTIPTRPLDEIYLDTAAAMTRSRIMSKADGVEEVIKLIDLFPAETRFFFNCWTWGYEELLRSVARRYKCKIHLDDYKQRIFSKDVVSDYDAEHSSLSRNCPPLADLGTSSYQTTRFHACERRWKCPLVRGDGQGCFEESQGQRRWQKQHARALQAEEALRQSGKLPHIVFANPAEATPTGWAAYAKKIKVQCGLAQHGLAEWPTNIVSSTALTNSAQLIGDMQLMPLARHSTLPELQDLVGLFRPKCVYPNTIYPEAKGADYLSLPSMFGHLLSDGGKDRLDRAARQHIAGFQRSAHYAQQTDKSEETEEDTEAREARLGKFASLPGRAGLQFLTVNFDHLEDPADIELLMLDADPQVPRSVDCGPPPPPVLDYLRPPARPSAILERGRSMVSTSSLMAIPEAAAGHYNVAHDRQSSPHLACPTSPRARVIGNRASSPLAAARPPPAPSPEATVVGQPQVARRTSSRNAKAFLAAKAFVFDQSILSSIGDLQDYILEAGGVIIQSGRSSASERTAVEIAHFVVCDRRAGSLYEMATEIGRPVGNKTWVARLLNHAVLVNPQSNLLWHPVPTEPLRDFAETVRVLLYALVLC